MHDNGDPDFFTNILENTFPARDIYWKSYHSVKRLIDEEIYVYVINNWSTDSTPVILKKFSGNPLFLGVEKFPRSGPGNYFNLYKLIERKEELARSISADWFITCDVDEVRESPWPGRTLKEGIFLVDRRGHNAIKLS